MRKYLLALPFCCLLATGVLAQNYAPPRPATAPPANEGPSFGPPDIAIPDVPVPSAAPEAPAKSQRPKIFRLPSARTSPQPPARKPFAERFKARSSARAAPPSEAPAFGAKGAAAPPPAEPEPTPKRLGTPRKFGPLEVFPKPKESDRTGNPLSIRRPVLAW